MKQTSLVITYKGQFEAISNGVRSLSEPHKLSCFLSGLKDEVRLPVRMLGPKNLNEAFGPAKMQEKYLWSCRRSSKIPHDASRPSILGIPKFENTRIRNQSASVEIDYCLNGRKEEERSMLSL